MDTVFYSWCAVHNTLQAHSLMAGLSHSLCPGPSSVWPVCVVQSRLRPGCEVTPAFLCTSAPPHRVMEMGLQATLFCLTPLILACPSFCSSWEALRLLWKSPLPSVLSWKPLSLWSPYDTRTARSFVQHHLWFSVFSTTSTCIFTHWFMTENVVWLKGIWFHKV